MTTVPATRPVTAAISISPKLLYRNPPAMFIPPGPLVLFVGSQPFTTSGFWINSPRSIAPSTGTPRSERPAARSPRGVCWPTEGELSNDRKTAARTFPMAGRSGAGLPFSFPFTRSQMRRERRVRELWRSGRDSRPRKQPGASERKGKS